MVVWGCLLDTQGRDQEGSWIHVGSRRKTWAADKTWESSDSI